MARCSVTEAGRTKLRNLATHVSPLRRGQTWNRRWVKQPSRLRRQRGTSSARSARVFFARQKPSSATTSATFYLVLARLVGASAVEVCRANESATRKERTQSSARFFLSVAFRRSGANQLARDEGRFLLGRWPVTNPKSKTWRTSAFPYARPAAFFAAGF